VLRKRSGPLEGELGGDLSPAVAYVAEDHPIRHLHILHHDLVEDVLAGEQLDRGDRHAGGREVQYQLAEAGVSIPLFWGGEGPCCDLAGEKLPYLGAELLCRVG
jgi:hypothetical protein